MTMVTKKSQSGFTLVELAIVLVIIGLIVGGVLVGQDLIKAASIRATVTQIEKFNAAATTFRGKYQGYPGDLAGPKAVEFGFQADLTPAGRTGAAGKGDGNGLLEGCSAGSTGLGCETAIFWSDLQKAGLVPSNTSITTASDLTAVGTKNNAALQPLLPTSKIRESALFTVFSNAGRNWYAISALSTTTGVVSTAPGLTPLEARGIDEKLDDGVPLTGVVSAIKTDLVTVAATADTPPCIVGTAPAITYIANTDSALNTVACSLSIRASF